MAIAGQAIVGRFLGSNDREGALQAGRRVLGWGIIVGLVTLVIFGAGATSLPDLFTNDPAVASLAVIAMIHLALLQPINGAVFALDGILIGAGDQTFLAWAMAGAAVIFIPLALAVPANDLGLGWLWATLWVLMAGRAVALFWRFRSERWLVLGEAVS